LAKKSAFLTQIKGNFAEKVIITLVLEKNANFFRRKLAKIAENCDHNIGPWRQCLVASSTPAIVAIEAMSREIESCQSIPRAVSY
jgi:hypothetical protein